MSSTFLTLKTVVTDAVGRSDVTALSYAERGVNFGQLLAALLFDPPELQTSGSLTLLTSGTSVSLSTLTRLLTLNNIYNATSSKPMSEIPYNLLKVITPSDPGNALYWSKWGSTLYTSPTPAVDNTLTVYYRQYPTPMDDDTDTIDFDHYDEFITSVALKYAWACFEEAEASDLWSKILDVGGLALTAGTKLRHTLEEVIKSGYPI